MAVAAMAAVIVVTEVGHMAAAVVVAVAVMVETT